MIKLFLDIETLPSHENDKELHLSILKSKRARSKTKTSGRISDEYLHKTTSFEGTFGRICCIGFIKENKKIEKGVLKSEEKDILKKFWKLAKDVDLFIGHNIFEFDLPFIYKRSIILGVRPTIFLNFTKFQSKPIFDTMAEWEKWSYGSRQSLDTLAKVLKFPSSKDEMDGSMVWDYYKEGKLEEIYKYCLKDVELTRQIYYRMIFEDPPK